MMCLYVKVLALVCVLVSLVSCERRFELEYEDMEDRLRVKCQPSTMWDNYTILVTGVRSMGKPFKKYKHPDGVDVKLFVDGELMEMSQWQSETALGFNVKHTPMPGQKIRLEASAAGFVPVHAEVVVPDPVEDFEVSFEELEDRYYGVTLKYADNPDTEDMYGVVVYLRRVKETLGGEFVEFVESEVCSGIELPSYFPDASDGILLDYANAGNIAIWRDTRANDGGYQNYTFSVRRHEDYQVSDTGLAVGNDGTHVVRTQYRVSVFKVSKEYYRYHFGVWSDHNNIMGAMGLASPTNTYTNIHGGLGVLGAISHIHGEWRY